MSKFDKAKQELRLLGASEVDQTTFDRYANICTFDAAKQELRSICVTLRRSEGGQFRVNLRGASEVTAYYASDLQDALYTGRAISDRSRHGLRR